MKIIHYYSFVSLVPPLRVLQRQGPGRSARPEAEQVHGLGVALHDGCLDTNAIVSRAPEQVDAGAQALEGPEGDWLHPLPRPALVSRTLRLPRGGGAQRPDRPARPRETGSEKINKSVRAAPLGLR